MNQPLAIDLCCGLGGWTNGLIEEGYHVVGFDVERHSYSGQQYPAQLVLQDVLTIHGKQFREAALIVASPPCQEYSYMAMPWTLAKKKAMAYRAEPATQSRLTALFRACFRIQAEASQAAGRHIPLVVENVRGAQPWVGKAQWNFGSYYLWGDVPALMPIPHKAQKFNPDRTKHGVGSWFAIADSKNRGASMPQAGSGKKTESVQRSEGFKTTGMNWSNAELRGQDFTRIAGRQDGIKQGGDWFNAASTAGDGLQSISRRSGSKSSARKEDSARIAMIPLSLARYIARVYHPI